MSTNIENLLHATEFTIAAHYSNGNVDISWLDPIIHILGGTRWDSALEDVFFVDAMAPFMIEFLYLCITSQAMDNMLQMNLLIIVKSVETIFLASVFHLLYVYLFACQIVCY